jgi:hypothetical protein
MTHTTFRAGSYGSLEAAVAAATAASREAPAEEAVDSVLRDALQRGGADRLSGAHSALAPRTPSQPSPVARAPRTPHALTRRRPRRHGHHERTHARQC